MAEKRYRIGEVASLAGISVRALHHYDAIGLLCPRTRSGSGYRLYDAGDLLRLQQIVIRRALGLSLEQIRASLDAPDFELKQALRRQRVELKTRLHETSEMIDAVDAALDAIEKAETPMKPDQLFKGFDPRTYEDEVKARWGDSDAYAESIRRTQSYTQEQWAQIHTENSEIMKALVECRARPEPPTSAAAMELAEQHRQHLDRWYYPCSPPMHVGLAEMYEADDRFAANIDTHGPGLTGYLAAAIRANAGRG